MKEKLKLLRKNWIMIWLVIAAVSLGSVITYAAYTRITIVKRVVSTTEGAGNLFSSNYLNTNTSSIMTTSSASYVEEDNNAIVTLDIYNYDTPKKIPFFKELSSLDYKIEVKLVKDSTGAELTEADKSIIDGDPDNNVAGLFYSFNGVTLNSSNRYMVTLDNQSINSTSANSNQYKIIFDKAEISEANAPGYMMYIKAIPAQGTDLKPLQGYIGVKMKSSIPSGWYGELIETSSTEGYDGYNYEIKGSGVGQLTVTYNSDKLTPNKYFFDDKSLSFVVKGNIIAGGTDNTDYINYSIGTNSSYNTGSFTLQLDSTAENAISRLIIQMYKTQSDEDYADVKSWITYSYTTNLQSD